MEALFRFLEANPYILLFLVVGMAVGVGRLTIKGYGLGMVAAAIVCGAAVATAASMYGVTLKLDNFTKSLFYYLFMYGVGLRVGPSFVNSLKGDGLRFAFLAVLTAPREVVHAQAFNVGRTDQNYRMREIAEIVKETVPGCEIAFMDGAGPDARNYRADFSKIGRLLPTFRPQWDARKGARQLYETYKAIGLELVMVPTRKLKHALKGAALPRSHEVARRLQKAEE